MWLYIFVFDLFCICFGLKKDEGWNYINLHCRSNTNDPVDWWYMYKPAGEAAPYDNSGRTFSYIISDILEAWQKPTKHVTTNNMLQHTLQPAYRGTYIDRIAYMVFEDGDSVESSFGSSTRGILMADELGGIFISHTVPYLASPESDRPKFPEAELQNGHLMMCISMNITTMNDLAVYVRHSGAKVIAMQIASSMRKVVPAWVTYFESDLSATLLDDGTGLNTPSEPLEFKIQETDIPGMVMLRKPGQDFCLYKIFAKRQKILMDVYSSNSKPKKSFCEKNYGTRVIDAISLNIQQEKVIYINNRTDRMRFAVAGAEQWQNRGSGVPQYWTCTSSLVKDDDSKKGGLLLCINDYQIWWAFSNFKLKEPKCGN